MNTVSVSKIVFNGFTLFVVADKVTLASCNVTGRFISKKLACVIYAQYKFFKNKKSGEFVTSYTPRKDTILTCIDWEMTLYFLVMVASCLFAFSGALSTFN